MFPSRKQWKKWSLPSKLTAIGAYVGIFALVLSVIFFVIPYFGQTEIIPAVPEVALTTNEGLPLSDFPNAIIPSPETGQRLRRHTLIVRNTNNIDFHNFSVRMQLPEPIIQEPTIEEYPAGVAITCQP